MGAEFGHQNRRTIAAKTIDNNGTEARRTAGAAGCQRLGRYLGDAERRQRGRPGKAAPRCFGGTKKRPVGSERRNCAVASGEQTADPFAQRQLRSGPFGCRNEDRGAIRQRDARANTCKRASEACSEAAQAFEPPLADRRQGCRKPDDLTGRRVL